MATLLAVDQMLDHVDLSMPGDELRAAVRTAAARRTTVTYDMGGTSGTLEVARRSG